MRSIATITADLDSLRSARAKGARRIRFADREVEYRSDIEIARTVAALEAELGQAQGIASPRTIVVRPPPFKGW
jgi:hypothetical protein